MAGNAAGFLRKLRKKLMPVVDGEEDIVLIKVQDENFPVHKRLLDLHSPVFEAMFRHDTLEKQEKTVRIREFSQEVIGEMIYYIYTGKTSNLHPDLAMRLYALANKYLIKQLQVICSNFLCSSLTVDLVPYALLLANRCGDRTFVLKCLIFAALNASRVVTNKKFFTVLMLEDDVRNLLLSINQGFRNRARNQVA